MSDNLCSRIAHHRDGSIPGFTKKYNVKTLVWFQYLNLKTARARQPQEWKRAWNCSWSRVQIRIGGIFTLKPRVGRRLLYNLRHPGERRDPGFQSIKMRQVWVSTFVGMTEVRDAFVRMTN